MLTKNGGLDIEAFDQRVRHAVTQAFQARTARDRRDLEIRIHPFDLEDLELAADTLWAGAKDGDWNQLAMRGVERRWRDVRIIGDVNIAQGSPELRLSWRVVL